MIRVLELFGGYGSQALALENLGIEFKSDLCEIDKYAIQAYNQIHGETFNYGDICSIDETKLPYYDLITYSSPCQDFSIAGKQAGGEKGSGTRSSLLWECERIIRAVKPKYLLMENVKALTSKKFMPLFAKWLNTLEELGYKNWWKVLNAKDYGVPQNRERVFVVSILGGGKYQFPNTIPLTKRLKDVLELNVDEKFYLSDEICQRFKYKKIGEDIVGSTKGENCTRSGQRDIVYSVEHKMGALAATDYKQPKQIMEPIKIRENTQKGYTEAYEGDSINLEQPNSQTRRGRVGSQVANTLTCSCNQGVVEPKIDVVGHYMESGHEASRILKTDGIYPTVKENHGTVPAIVEPKIIQVGNIGNTNRFGGNPNGGRVYDTKGICACISTMQGGGLEPKVVVEGYFKYPNSEKKHQSNTIISKEGISSTLDTMSGGNLQPKILEVVGSTQKNAYRGDGNISPALTSAMGMGGGQIPMAKFDNYRIRKLTPRECWRLMGVRDEQFDKLHDISNSQLYKMAGNSIVVDVLMGIFKNMFMPDEQEQKGQLELL